MSSILENIVIQHCHLFKINDALKETSFNSSKFSCNTNICTCTCQLWIQMDFYLLCPWIQWSFSYIHWGNLDNAHFLNIS